MFGKDALLWARKKQKLKAFFWFFDFVLKKATARKTEKTWLVWFAQIRKAYFNENRKSLNFFWLFKFQNPNTKNNSTRIPIKNCNSMWSIVTWMPWLVPLLSLLLFRTLYSQPLCFQPRSGYQCARLQSSFLLIRLVFHAFTVVQKTVWLIRLVLRILLPVLETPAVKIARQKFTRRIRVETYKVAKKSLMLLFFMKNLKIMNNLRNIFLGRSKITYEKLCQLWRVYGEIYETYENSLKLDYKFLIKFSWSCYWKLWKNYGEFKKYATFLPKFSWFASIWPKIFHKWKHPSPKSKKIAVHFSKNHEIFKGFP